MEMETARGVLIVVHGGAGRDIRRADHSAEREAACRAGLEAALRAGHAVLRGGGSVLDAVEATVRTLEDDPYFNAARGASFSYEGRVELDASLMDGRSGMAGAVAGVTTIKNPVTLARAVMEKSPFVLLSGEGADQFGRENGLETVPNEYFHTPGRSEQWRRLRESGVVQNTAALPDGIEATEETHGTVGAVARDFGGNLAAATSTGGMAGKRYGRIGDSPIIGAGTWADNAACGLSATGHGEFFIRKAVAHDVAARMAYGGRPLVRAALETMAELTAIGDGGFIALDAQGNAVLPFNTGAMYRGYLLEDGTVRVGIFDDERL
jgi:L-asparaginase / beta-aspartyl-peptidase